MIVKNKLDYKDVLNHINNLFIFGKAEFKLVDPTSIQTSLLHQKKRMEAVDETISNSELITNFLNKKYNFYIEITLVETFNFNTPLSEIDLETITIDYSSYDNSFTYPNKELVLEWVEGRVVVTALIWNDKWTNLPKQAREMMFSEDKEVQFLAFPILLDYIKKQLGNDT